MYIKGSDSVSDCQGQEPEIILSAVADPAGGVHVHAAGEAAGEAGTHAFAGQDETEGSNHAEEKSGAYMQMARAWTGSNHAALSNCSAYLAC